jgi:hypothetical protein
VTKAKPHSFIWTMAAGGCLAGAGQWKSGREGGGRLGRRVGDTRARKKASD